MSSAPSSSNTSFAEPHDGTSELPPSRWLKRLPDMGFEASLRLLAQLKSKPPGREDANLLDDDDVDSLVGVINFKMPEIRSKMQKSLSARALKELSDDQVRAIVAYTAGPPFNLYLIVNAVMMACRSQDDFVTHCGPFIKLLMSALQTLDLKTDVEAARATRVQKIPALMRAFQDPTVLGNGSCANFWHFASFTCEDRVMNDPAFSGKPNEPAIIYKCPKMACVDIACFSMAPCDEKEVIPVPPAMFVVTSRLLVPGVPKLVVILQQVDNTPFQYLPPAPHQQFPTAPASPTSSSSAPSPVQGNIAVPAVAGAAAPPAVSVASLSGAMPTMNAQEVIQTFGNNNQHHNQPFANPVGFSVPVPQQQHVLQNQQQQHQQQLHQNHQPFHHQQPPPLNTSYNQMLFHGQHQPQFNATFNGGHHHHHHHQQQQQQQQFFQHHPHLNAPHPQFDQHNSHSSPNLFAQNHQPQQQQQQVYPPPNWQAQVQQQQQQSQQQQSSAAALQLQQLIQQAFRNPPARVPCVLCGGRKRSMKWTTICKDCSRTVITQRLAPAAQKLGGPSGLLRFSTKEAEPFWELANSYPSQIKDQKSGRVFPTLDHIFQAAKFVETAPQICEQIRNAKTAHEAFDIAHKNHHLERSDWNARREDVMLFLLRAKFFGNKHCQAALRVTGATVLVYQANDAQWGNAQNDSGKNRLGFLLMQVRHEIEQHQRSADPFDFVAMPGVSNNAVSSDDENNNKNSSATAANSNPNFIKKHNNNQQSQQGGKKQSANSSDDDDEGNEGVNLLLPLLAALNNANNSSGNNSTSHSNTTTTTTTSSNTAGGGAKPGCGTCCNTNCPCDAVGGFSYCCRTCAQGKACTRRVHVATPTGAATTTASSSSSSSGSKPCAGSGCKCHVSVALIAQGFTHCCKSCAGGTPCSGAWHH